MILETFIFTAKEEIALEILRVFISPSMTASLYSNTENSMEGLLITHTN